MNDHVSTTFTALEQSLHSLELLSSQLSSYLNQSRPAALPGRFYEQVFELEKQVNQIQKQAQNMEDERRNLRALAQIGQVVNSSLDLNIVLQIVMDTIIRLTGAERGFLMLKSPQGELIPQIARNWEQETLHSDEFAVSRTIIERVTSEGQPVLTTNAQDDPRFGKQQSVITYNLRSILCVPLRVKSEITGVIYADNRIRSGLFTHKELELLSAFSHQAAVAIENARLFDSVRQTLAEVTELKNLMDNVFSSIASGVLTADVQERIVMCNRAAELILQQSASQLIGKQLKATLPPLAPAIEPQLKHVLETDQPVLGFEISQELPARGQVDLRLSLTPLKDVEQTTQGVAIVLDDLTEKKHLEAQRRLFERMVSPAVINQLNPDDLPLDGQRKEITVLFADIRGFTSFSEDLQPEKLVKVLNLHLAAAADAILHEEGTIDKFMGDAVMAWFNAPIPQQDHPMRAIRSALAIRDALTAIHQQLPEKFSLSFGIGIHLGDAVLGLIGTEKRLEYTAIGDSVNIAKRIQENAAPNQILISEAVLRLVESQVIVQKVEDIQAKGKRTPIPVYEVIGLR